PAQLGRLGTHGPDGDLRAPPHVALLSGPRRRPRVHRGRQPPPGEWSAPRIDDRLLEGRRPPLDRAESPPLPEPRSGAAAPPAPRRVHARVPRLPGPDGRPGRRAS